MKRIGINFLLVLGILVGTLGIYGSLAPLTGFHYSDSYSMRERCPCGPWYCIIHPGKPCPFSKPKPRPEPIEPMPSH